MKKKYYIRYADFYFRIQEYEEEGKTKYFNKFSDAWFQAERIMKNKEIERIIIIRE